MSVIYEGICDAGWSVCSLWPTFIIWGVIARGRSVCGHCLAGFHPSFYLQAHFTPRSSQNETWFESVSSLRGTVSCWVCAQGSIWKCSCYFCRLMFLQRKPWKRNEWKEKAWSKNQKLHELYVEIKRCIHRGFQSRQMTNFISRLCALITFRSGFDRKKMYSWWILWVCQRRHTPPIKVMVPGSLPGIACLERVALTSWPSGSSFACNNIVPKIYLILHLSSQFGIF